MNNILSILGLLVDDDEDQPIIMADLFSDISEFNITLDWASTLQQAKELIKRRPYDLILVDQYLAQDRGIDFVAELKQTGVDTPAILISGRGDDQLKQEALLKGAAGFLLKAGLSADVLRTSILNAINKRLDIVIESLS